MNRRDFCKLSVSAVVAGIWGKAFGISTAGAALPEKQEKAKVYFIRDITPDVISITFKVPSKSRYFFCLFIIKFFYFIL